MLSRKVSKFSITFILCIFLILHRVQSAGFCESVVYLNQNLDYYFVVMNDYPYATHGANGWFRCDGLHCPGFPTLLRDVLHRFGYTGTPTYHGRPYH
jgi:hypothetical protein